MSSNPLSKKDFEDRIKFAQEHGLDIASECNIIAQLEILKIKKEHRDKIEELYKALNDGH